MVGVCDAMRCDSRGMVAWANHLFGKDEILSRALHFWLQGCKSTLATTIYQFLLSSRSVRYSQFLFILIRPSSIHDSSQVVGDSSKGFVEGNEDAVPRGGYASPQGLDCQASREHVRGPPALSQRVYRESCATDIEMVTGPTPIPMSWLITCSRCWVTMQTLPASARCARRKCPIS